MNYGIDALNFAQQIGIEQPDWEPNGQKLPVYLVPLDKLYYNNDNGRIATWISSYADLENQPSLEKLSQDEYNKKVQEFIKNSNTPDSYKKTLNDVRIKGQIHPGVVLNDGRVVSGNRRFTVLRELHEETGSDKFGFFKCFIIDKDLENEEDRKYIKTIERLTQFGTDEKVDYDPIARLVDVYNDLLGPRKIWSTTEYAKKLHMKVTDVELMCNKALIMVDYLNYINKPNKFYIARQQKLDGPLQELAPLYKKVSINEWNRIRIVFYMSLTEAGDTTRNIRDLKRVYTTESFKFDSLIRKCQGDIEKQEDELFDLLDEKKFNQEHNTQEKSNIKMIEDIKLLTPSDETKKEIFESITEAKLEEKRAKKVSVLFQSIDNLVLNINDTYQQMKPTEKNKLDNKIHEIEKALAKFKGE